VVVCPAPGSPHGAPNNRAAGSSRFPGHSSCGRVSRVEDQTPLSTYQLRKLVFVSSWASPNLCWSDLGGRAGYRMDWQRPEVGESRGYGKMAGRPEDLKFHEAGLMNPKNIQARVRSVFTISWPFSTTCTCIVVKNPKNDNTKHS
jgi:hypothetical protein